MNLLDRAISVVSPTAGLKRARARLAHAAIERLGYDGATAGRRTSGWTRNATSANAEIGPAMAKLRDGARDLVRNTPMANKAVLEIATKSVGSGIIPRARTSSPALNTILDDNFAQWAEELNADGKPDFWGLQQMAARTIVESGEAILRFRPRRISDGLTVPLQMQLLEPDWIDHSRTMPLPDGYILQGVEFDLLGRERAVWMFPAHPGDFINVVALSRPTFTPYSVPIETNNPLEGIERGFRKDRPGQVRGVTWFSPVMMAIHELSEYEYAERVRKKVEACLAIIYSGSDTGDLSPALGAQTTEEATGSVIEQLRPGMIARIPGASAITTLQPKPAGGFGEYKKAEHRLIAAGLGIPYEILTGDLSEINYSSFRGGLVGFRDVISVFQWNVIIPFICKPVWRRFVDACKIAGIVPLDTGYEVEWTPPAFDLLDRQHEATADEKMIRLGTMTWAQAVGAQGYDAKKQLRDIAEMNALWDDAGVVLDCDPRRIGKYGLAQKPAADTAIGDDGITPTPVPVPIPKKSAK